MSPHNLSQPTPTCATTDPAQLIAHPDRNRGDKCPGTLHLHSAADGKIGRVRFPGGKVTAANWENVAQIATTLGDGTIHITTRGNMQFRGISDDAAFISAVENAGLLPSHEHDKIRNILCSPLHPELWELAEALDNALLTNRLVAGLSGRTLFGIDAGKGDIQSQRVDFGIRRLKAEDSFELILAGEGQGTVLDIHDAISALVFAAEHWQTQRGSKWRLVEDSKAQDNIHALIRHTFTTTATTPSGIIHDTETHRPIGWIDNPDGTVTLGVGLQFGFLSAQVATLLGVIGAHTSITPWSSLVIHNLAEGDAEAVAKVLAPQGLIFDANSPWLKVTACTGAPGCEKSLSNTKQDAALLVSSGEPMRSLVHFSGCDRRCGHPLGHHTEYVATGDGEYEVTTR
ncbi:precorrin-3B synthase [Corynebacterium felinum]|uniref:Precorrin-3B synthase n=1 Tax=Corynebacterium felinum TaxID=131318 RepID=A0ABU2BAI3_9CORY|nr:precorrin-3B synthase [Corynebacterium felinum]MDF5819500.1 precorrin-3B synthase [Corynebacterium felinum]MDR7355632.1 precorrin-3B synthase [Corynebacterium felinum]WJY94984.1 ferredoxin-nitrite reductase [Corynebacterium felinum]